MPNGAEFLSLKDRFESFLDREDSINSCWNWTGTKTKDGSCLFWYKDNNRMARKVSYLIYKDQNLDDKLKVFNTCKNKQCVNPKHLVAGGIKERFMRFVNKLDNGCWQWTGGIGTTGYGMFEGSGKLRKAHRAGYILFKGDIPEDLLVCHSCDNMKCVNPDHLWLGTYSENMKDKHWKNRGNNPFGQNSGQAKLTNEEAISVVRDFKIGLTTKELALKFNITRSCVRDIINGNTWNKVTMVRGS